MTKTERQQRTRITDLDRVYRGACGGWHYRGTARKSHRPASCAACNRLATASRAAS